MRNAFAEAITLLGEEFPHLVLLTGDIGNRLFDRFKAQHPERFYNCGVAEANMTGVAAGLARAGLQPITYTITPFNTVRCLEQIRLDVCYGDLPVIIVGTGSGLSYAGLGATHHSMEDIALLRTLPNMHVVCPGDPVEVGLALRRALELRRPTYLRLGKKGEPLVHLSPPEFCIGRGIIVREGHEVDLLSVGNFLPIACQTAEALQAQGISGRVISWHSVKPFDEALLSQSFEQKRLIVILEEHALAGGAGSAVLEWGNAQGFDLNKVLCIAGPDRFLTACGSQRDARKLLGFSAEAITQKIIQRLSQSHATRA